ncbi:MAG: ABC transporter ATP-binding protein [Bacteroides sp.]|nr:ABC transporter ATP-binding protein [Bacteroides sp.]
MIEINEVSKTYSESSILSLDGITLSIPEGSIVGLIGVNGAGKSTLLRVAAGIYRQDKGSVTIDGEPVYENNNAKSKIAFISDEQYYRPGMNMKKAAGIQAALRDSFSVKKFYALAEEYGLDVKRPLSSFSKGMRRQNDIITALSCESKYILCDETFDGLDPITREKTKKSFIENVADSGTTILLSSHNLQELEDICDRIVLLDKGRLVLSAELDDLKDKVNKYQLMFENNRYGIDTLDPLEPFALTQSGQVISFIAAGDEAEIKERANAIAEKSKNRLVYIEALPLSLDEIFSYKLKTAGLSELSELTGGAKNE